MGHEPAIKRRATAAGPWLTEPRLPHLGAVHDAPPFSVARTSKGTPEGSYHPWGLLTTRHNAFKPQLHSYTQIVVEVKTTIRFQAWNYSAVLPVAPTTPPDYGELDKALAELNSAVVEAASDRGILPEELAARAETLLRWMYDTTPFPYDVRPEKDGGISIHAIGDETYILIILSPNQPDKCFVNTKKVKSRIVFKDRLELFGRHLRGALRDLRDSEYPIVASTAASVGQHLLTAAREVAGRLRG